jgi:uncharacterized protein
MIATRQQRSRKFQRKPSRMALPSRLYDGFLPGRHAMTGFGQGGFRFADMSHKGSLAVMPSGFHAIVAPDPFRHDEGLYAMVFAEAADIDILLVGAGSMPLPIPDSLRWRLRDARISADVMTTASACSTFNVLLGEGRRVAALLVAVA